jgi:melibiose permease/lactose/raffinose/galactose permease
MAFNNKGITGWNFVIYFGVIYFLYSITYTMNDISYWGMVPALSSNGNIRNKFTSRATLFAGIGSTLASVLIPMLTTGNLALGGNAVTAFGHVAIIICILSPLFAMFTLFGVKENRNDMAKPAPKISLKMIVKTITGNDQLMWISLIFLLQQIGNGLVVGGIGSIYIYFEFGYAGGLYSLFTMVGMFVTAFLMIFYPALAKKVHRKGLMINLQVISLIGYAIMLLSGLFLPAGNMIKFYVITFGYMLANFGQYGFYLIMMISIMNTVEYNELKHGTRDEGIVSSLRPFLTKLASALTIAIATGTYIVFGLLKYTNGIAAQEQLANQGLITETEKGLAITELLKDVQPSQANALMIVMTVLPCLLMFLSYILYKKHYKLDEDEYDRICEEIKSKKNEGAFIEAFE